MAAFEYLALDARGRQQKGVLEADSARQVRQLLRERQLAPLEVRATRVREQAERGRFSLARGLSARDLALVTRQLATLVQAALPIEEALRAVERQAECTLNVPPELDALESHIAAALAERLQSRAEPNQPGYMILNPCGFARRAVVELEGVRHPLPIGGIVKACQLDGGLMRAVIEIPALGFAWLPREGPPGTPAMTTKFRIGDAATKTMAMKRRGRAKRMS